MSIQAMSWVLDYSKSRLADRLVMIGLGNEADPCGLSCHPGQRLIAAEARICRAHVRRSILRLEAAGEVLVLRPEKQGRGHFNRYAVVGGRDPIELARFLGWPEPTLDASVVAEFDEITEDDPEQEGQQIVPLPWPPADHSDRRQSAPLSVPVDNGERATNQEERSAIRDVKGPPRDGPDPLDPLNPKTASSAGEIGKPDRCATCSGSTWVNLPSTDSLAGDALPCPDCNPRAKPDDPRYELIAREPETRRRRRLDRRPPPAARQAVDQRRREHSPVIPSESSAPSEGAS